MALSTQVAPLAKRRAGNWISGFSKPYLQLAYQQLFSWFAQFAGSPDLQIVEFAALSSTEVVIADAPCKLHALFLMKATATATYTKLTDNATTSSDTAADIVLKMAGAGNETLLVYPQGLALANGATMQGNTTADAGTGSAADGANGFAVVGKA